MAYVPFSTSDVCWCQPFDAPAHPFCPLHGSKDSEAFIRITEDAERLGLPSEAVDAALDAVPEIVAA